MKNVAIVSLSALVLVVGCSTERSIPGYSDDLRAFDVNEFRELGDLEGGQGWLSGDFGPRTNVDSTAQVSGYDEGDYTMVEVLANDGETMHAIDIYGGLNHPALRAGETFSFDLNDSYDLEPGRLYFTTYVCSGDQAYQWDYDEPATRTDVTVTETEDPEVLRVDYVSVVEDPSGLGLQPEQRSEGFFEVKRPSEGDE